jgi:excisionase family DNA binding protein
MKDKNNKEYFSTIEVAKCLHISRIAVFRKIQSGQIPAQKIGRNYAITREVLEAILGSKLTENQREEIKTVVKRATKEYRDTFERLAKE